MVIAAIFLSIGVGYAYSAITTNSNNNTTLTYLTMVPTDGNGDVSYSLNFSGKNVKYDSEFRLGTEDDGDNYEGNDVVVYTLANDAYDTVLMNNTGVKDALKLGELYLQIDENKAASADDYVVNVVADVESATAGLNTDRFSFKVGFQTKHIDDSEEIIKDNTIQISDLPSNNNLKDYVKNSGATSAPINNTGKDITVVKVTLWLVGMKTGMNEQVFLLSDIYDPETPMTPEQPMKNVKFTFTATTTFDS